MSLEVKNRHNEAVFEFLWCIVCGETEFTHIPFEGVFCDNCNTEVSLKEPNDQRGYPERYIIEFSTDPTWNLHREDKLRRPIPNDRAQVTVAGEPGDYDVTYISEKRESDWEVVEKHEFAEQEEPEAVEHLA